MAVTLETAKLYLRVDTDIEDEFIKTCILAAESYLESAVDYFSYLYDEDKLFSAKADMVKLTLIAEMYRNRDSSNDTRRDYSYCIRSQLTQLQNWVDEKSDATDKNGVPNFATDREVDAVLSKYFDGD